MKKMMMMYVFVFAFVFNTMAYEQFGEGDKDFASWMVARKLGAERYQDAAACAAICKDMEQAELIRKQKKLVEVQIELTIEQTKLAKTQRALLEQQTGELIKTWRKLLEEVTKKITQLK